MDVTWTCAARGSTSRAARFALQAARVAEDAGQHVFRAIALHDAARFGETRRAAAALAVLEGHIDGELVPALAAHASALSGGRAGDLERASHRFETLGAVLLAAEAAADAAIAHRSVGRATRAESLAIRSDRLAARCGEPQTPTLRRMRDGLPLTPREREVATLAAQGLSDAEIAGRLVVSVRTVGNHLHRCYTKLEVAGRGELRSVFRECLPR